MKLDPKSCWHTTKFCTELVSSVAFICEVSRSFIETVKNGLPSQPLFAVIWDFALRLDWLLGCMVIMTGGLILIGSLPFIWFQSAERRAATFEKLKYPGIILAVVIGFLMAWFHPEAFRSTPDHPDPLRPILGLLINIIGAIIGRPSWLVVPRDPFVRFIGLWAFAGLISAAYELYQLIRKKMPAPQGEH